jgi:hypothetical protein
MHCHGGQAVAKRRVGQQGVAELVGGLVPRFEALDGRTSVGVGRGAPYAVSLTHSRAVDDHGEVLAGRAEVADHLPDGVSRCVVVRRKRMQTRARFQKVIACEPWPPRQRTPRELGQPLRTAIRLFRLEGTVGAERGVYYELRLSLPY